MAAYVFANYKLPRFYTTGAVIYLNSAGQPVYHIGNVVTITTDNGLKNDGKSPPK